MNPDMDGILLVDKPHGWTSFDVVAKTRSLIRAQTGQKKCKVGHSGTLDPLATGLLIVLVGSYTKQADTFTKLDKTYTADIVLGYTSATGDEEGKKTKHDIAAPPLRAEVLRVLEGLLGEQMQTPPQYSAVKIGGVPAYKLARAGKTAAIQSRPVTIHELSLESYSYPSMSIRCSVSSGTYIRVLAEDIGAALGTGAYVSSLRRHSVDSYSVSDACSIAQLEKDVRSCLQKEK